MNNLKYLLLLSILCSLVLFTNCGDDNKEKKLLNKEVELLKKEVELLKNNSSDKKIDESSVYNKENALAIKQSVEDRIIEIREFYSKIEIARRKKDNCISATKGEGQVWTAEECKWADGFSFQWISHHGLGWRMSTSFYYKGDQLFFVFVDIVDEGAYRETRVYYDREGEVIRMLEKYEDQSMEDGPESKEFTDESVKQRKLSSIADDLKKLNTLLLTVKKSKIYIDENGIVKCQEDVPVGFIGEVDGVSYKVVDSVMLSTMIKNDEDLRFICTTKITDMNRMFLESKFNGNISKWDVSNVTNMGDMFSESQFNGDISKWDVSNVTDMSRMFRDSEFNGDISNWDVSNVTDMNRMFRKSQFNGDISNWNVSNVVDCWAFSLDATAWTEPEPNFTNCTE